MSPKILTAADDPVQRRLLETLVHQFGQQAETVETGEAVRIRLQSPGAPAIGLAILDLVMPDRHDGVRAAESLPIIFESS